MWHHAYKIKRDWLSIHKDLSYEVLRDPVCLDKNFVNICEDLSRSKSSYEFEREPYAKQHEPKYNKQRWRVLKNCPKEIFTTVAFLVYRCEVKIKTLHVVHVEHCIPWNVSERASQCVQVQSYKMAKIFIFLLIVALPFDLVNIQTDEHTLAKVIWPSNNKN